VTEFLDLALLVLYLDRSVADLLLNLPLRRFNLLELPTEAFSLLAHVHFEFFEGGGLLRFIE
jgi:hypothetical protein